MKAIKFNYTILLYLLLLFSMNLYGQSEQHFNTAIKNSDVIVIGKVIEKNVYWDDDKEIIYTSAKLLISKTIKGDIQNKEIEIAFPGGHIGSKTFIFHSSPELSLGEEIATFLIPISKNRIFSDSKDKHLFKNYYRPIIGYKNKYSINNGKIDNGDLVEVFIQKIKNIEGGF